MTPCISALVVPEPLYAAIWSTVGETPEGLETGVTLFGARLDGASVALFAASPGPAAVHLPGFHRPDTDHVNREYDRLRTRYPSLAWIGSLHAHPPGMTGLSGHDRRTVAALLALHSDALCLPDFVAGIIQRRGERFAIYPYLCTPEEPAGLLLPVQVLGEEAPLIRAATNAAKERTAPDDPRARRNAQPPCTAWWRRAVAKLRRPRKKERKEDR